MQITDSQRFALLAPRQGRLRVVIDTDTYNEIDDQFALVQAMLSPERIDLEAIYAAPFTNEHCSDPALGMEQSYQEILRLLERLERSPEGLVHRGVTGYVGMAKRALPAPAVDDLVARARSASPEAPLYVVAIACISNVASALLAAPDIIDRIVVVWLGGHALEWPHQREFNLEQDVGGVQVLFDSGVPLVLVPCEGVTSCLHSSVPEIERYVEPFGAIGAFLAMRFKAYEKDHVGWAKEIWDMGAVAWALDAGWAPSILVPTPVLGENLHYATDRTRHAMRYVTHINRTSIMRDFVRRLAARAAVTV